MPEPSDVFRELVLRYEESVREKEDKLADFRRQAEAYASFIESEIAGDQKRLDRLRAELASIEASKANRPAAPQVAAPAASTGGSKARPAPSKSSDRTTGSQSEMIRRAAKEILAKAEGPLMQHQLKLKMQEMGVEIISTDPKELIRAALKDRPEFRHIKGEGWALAAS